MCGVQKQQQQQQSRGIKYHTTTPDATEASKWTNTPSWSPVKPGAEAQTKSRRLRNKCVVVNAADNSATMEHQIQDCRLWGGDNRKLLGPLAEGGSTHVYTHTLIQQPLLGYVVACHLGSTTPEQTQHDGVHALI